MKKEDLFSLMGEVDEQKVADAQSLPVKRSPWLKWGAVAACICLVAVSAFALHIAPAPTGEEKLYISMGDVFINELSDMEPDASKLRRDLTLYEKVLWDEPTVMDYYGKNLVPAYIPEGLMAAPGNGKGYAYIRKSDGKVVEDEVRLGFYHAYYEDGTPKLTDGVAAPKGFYLRASKLGLIHECFYMMPENEVKTSDMNGTPVMIGYRSMPYGPYSAETHEPSGYYDLYVAEFKFDGIDYQIVAEQMEKEDVIKVVASIVSGEVEVEIIE